MKFPYKSTLLAALLVPVFVLPQLAASETGKKEEPEKREEEVQEEVIVLSPFQVTAPSGGGYGAMSTFAGTRFGSSPMGATVGGAKDARYFRDVVAQGGFPHPASITPEGLFSEHDLPLKNRVDGEGLLIINGEAMRTTLVGEPSARYLAQIGFASGLSAKDWHRAPLNLVAVVDKSGSMDGQPLKLVKDCLQQILSQLGPDDQLSIVLYGDQSHVHLKPTRTNEANHGEISRAIELIRSSGSTNMEAGLKVGFELARKGQRTFTGTTRVMQFTDERPNTGDTRPGSFMAMMEDASHDGIGQTTIGVGVQFGAELASKISSVRGANLFFFPNAEEMMKTFREEFDTLVTELAYDMDVSIKAAKGLRIVGVYGLPGELLTWSGDDEVNFHVTTLFLSKRRGAIYLALAPGRKKSRDDVAIGGRLALAKLSYLPVGEDDFSTSQVHLPLVTGEECSPGLRRGALLVSEYLGLRGAMTAHLVKNDQESAFQILSELRAAFAQSHDATLVEEEKLVATLHEQLATLSGHGSGSDSVSSSEDLPQRRKGIATRYRAPRR